MDAIRSAGDRKVDGIVIRGECLMAIARTRGNVNQIVAAITTMLVHCKASNIDPLTLFR